MKQVGHVARMGKRGLHIKFWWEAREKRSLRRHGSGWEYNIRMDLGEIV
jgi:hypothetical protein